MFKTKIFNDSGDWERFISKHECTTFVQSPEYGEFYESMGNKYWIVGVFKNDDLIGGALCVSVYARRGAFLYIPYGPIFETNLPKEDREQAHSIFFDFLKNFGVDQKFDFIKISPFVENTARERGLYKEHGFVDAPMHILAEYTWILDITHDTDYLLRNMKKNHRNLIRRCEREGVRITKSAKVEDLAGLNDLLDITAERHDFVRFSRKYIEKEFKVFAQNDKALVFNAYLPDGRLDGAAIIMFYGNMAAYRHSASIHHEKHLPTAYLLQWHAILEAKKRGIEQYNFWGIAPSGADQKHPFYGITHFKKGFGGYKKDIIHCQDFKLTWKYYINWILETLRKKKRGF